MELSIDMNKRYSFADIIKGVFGDLLVELYDGIIKVMSAPLDIHADISFNTTMLFGSLLKKHKGKCKIRHAPYAVRFSDDTVVHPDVCVICDLKKIDKYGCIGAPDLIVEILSPSTASRDWRYKYDLYEKHGVREYWIIDPANNTVTVFILKDGKYDDAVVYEEGDIPIFIFDNELISLTEIFLSKY